MAELTGVKKLRRLQMGREGTPGSAVEATDTWRGTGTIEDGTVVIFPDEDVGLYPQTTRSYIPSKVARLTMDETPATFKQIRHIFEAGIQTAVSSADGAGAGWKWSYPLPSTVSDTLKTYTIEGGDNIECEEMEYAFVEHFNLSGAPGEAVMLTADWVGRQVSTSVFTSTATCLLPAVEEILFSLGKIYIDNDTLTATETRNQLTNTWLEFNLDVVTGWQPVTTGDGALYFTYIKNVKPEVTLDVVFEHNAAALVEKDDWKTQQGKVLRMTFLGSTFTAGTSFENETLRIDLAGKFEKFEKIGERAGNDVLEATFKAGYSSVSATFAEFFMVVSDSAVD